MLICMNLHFEALMHKSHIVKIVIFSLWCLERIIMAPLLSNSSSINHHLRVAQGVRNLAQQFMQPPTIRKDVWLDVHVNELQLRQQLLPRPQNISR